MCILKAIAVFQSLKAGLFILLHYFHVISVSNGVHSNVILFLYGVYTNPDAKHFFFFYSLLPQQKLLQRSFGKT